MNAEGFVKGAVLALLAALCLPGSAQPAAFSDTVDMGAAMPQAKELTEGLFPEGACDPLRGGGCKCMGFKPPVRFLLPATAFKLGSAELPDSLRKQLDVFAEVLRSKKGSGKQIRIEGHSDASGSAAANLALSQRRADAVKDYLVKQGADSAMLTAVGMGAKMLKNPDDPNGAENRRVEIRREPS